jgi:single-stranded-DNA-specific exonuclease
MGKSMKQHVKMTIDAGQNKWPAVFWNASERVDRDFSLGDKVDIVFRMGRNYFQNREHLQLTILDIQK